MEKEEVIRVSNMFNYKLGQLPMSYLGIDTGNRVIHKRTAERIISKLGNRLDNWKNNLLSLLK